MKTLYVLAGPNGCGKSTLRQYMGIPKGVVNVDPDALGAREAVRQRRAAIRDGRSLMLETTLTGRSTVGLIEEARRAGYRVVMYYTCVRSAQRARERIISRVAQGGHDIPVKDAVRRFARSLETLPGVIPLTDETQVFDNSRSDAPHRQVAVVRGKKAWIAHGAPKWAKKAVRESGQYDDMARPGSDPHDDVWQDDPPSGGTVGPWATEVEAKPWPEGGPDRSRSKGDC